MNSHLQKSVEESFERLLRTLLNSEYFDRLSFEEKIDIIMSLIEYISSLYK